MLIVKLLQEKLISPTELYSLLNRKGNRDRDKDGGLGTSFHKKTRLSLISEIFDIDDINKTVSIQNIDKLFELAQHFKNGTQVTKNANKQAICLALICYHSSLKEKKYLLQAIDELINLYSKNGALRDKSGLIIKLLVSKKASLLQSIQIKEKRNSPDDKIHPSASLKTTVSQAETKVLATIQLSMPAVEIKNSVDPSSNSLTMHEADAKTVIAPIMIPSTEPQEKKTPNLMNKTPEEVVRKLLVNMNSNIPDHYSISQIKRTQKKFFYSQLELLNLEELKYLCEFMNQVQSGQNRSLHFAIIRREQCVFFDNGNTRTWEELYNAARRKLIIKLKESTGGQKKIKLHQPEYDNYTSLLNTYAGRWSGSFWKKTPHSIDFEISFEATEESIPASKATKT